MTSKLRGKAKIIDIRYADPQDCLSVVEQNVDIPFKIKELVPFGLSKYSVRGEHVTRNWQLLIPINGAFDILLDDSESTYGITLDSPAKGLPKPVTGGKLHQSRIMHLSIGFKPIQRKRLH